MGVHCFERRVNVDEEFGSCECGYGHITITERSTNGYSCMVAFDIYGTLKVISDPWSMIGSFIEITYSRWGILNFKNINQTPVVDGRRYAVSNLNHFN